ncbi:DUF1028 domain-containing protein [Ancylobacter dichloromethanicus]|uniref:Fimbrial assembly protein FimA n=1 Tax=Ancylobacter dichloromethanicus TaxID=518825 RepID=A0A9W6JCR4_9HYPH|nr:DUF1028 domain-containing protein [Ancylobacter dichloromethanicus]MBS7552174.1 DUF1028 domain-containing protein [Ancylobacter dichloromethanicus]GLK73908.1 hypothetical protein GCM10017643_40260 [Ancylobacter dichloromethanicus]
MTFSISAHCARTGHFGIAVSSSSPCVAARCAHARAGVGAVATQNITDPTLGPKGLDLMASGLSAPQALARLRAEGAHIDYRQFALVDAKGGTAGFSGARTLGTHRVAEGEGVVAAGNLLSSPQVPQAMVDAFTAAQGPLGDRLIAAMKAAVAAGGEEGPVHSAGMLLVDKVAWPVADLRVDWHEADPIGALGDLWELWKPQMEAYVTRALDPSTAPSYGVPGDE